MERREREFNLAEKVCLSFEGCLMNHDWDMRGVIFFFFFFFFLTIMDVRDSFDASRLILGKTGS